MPKSRNDAGFSLVEVAVAMAVVAVLSFGVMYAFTTSGVQDRRAYEVTRNQNVAAAAIEQVEAQTFQELEQLVDVPIQFTNERWTFTVLVTRIATDLLAIDTTTQVTSGDNSGVIRLSTLRARKEDAF